MDEVLQEAAARHRFGGLRWDAVVVHLHRCQGTVYGDAFDMEKCCIVHSLTSDQRLRCSWC
jgi:hypothetical protein